jgi:formylglycine-generating enzyme required for sulfatase activity/serine/threonine protein kinase
MHVPGLCPVCRLEPTIDGGHCCGGCVGEQSSRPRCPRCHSLVESDETMACGACQMGRPAEGWPRPPFPFEGGYEVLAELERKRSGVIYLAARDFDTSERTAREHVVLKVGTDYAAKDTLYESYRAEFLKLGRFGGQPDIMQVMGVERTRHKAPYVVMELVGGSSLGRIMERAGGPFELGAAVWIGWKVAEALAKVHGQRLIHLNLQPANILVNGWGSSRERITLAGFGAALELHSPGSASFPLVGEEPGAPRWLSPELAVVGRGVAGGPKESVALDHRADLYGLGLLLYYMLTSASPFDPEPTDERGWRLAHRTREPVEPWKRRKDLPRRLCDVVMRCLAKDPGERYAATSEVIEALREVLLCDVLPEVRQRVSAVGAHVGVEAAPDRWRDRVRMAERKVEELSDDVHRLHQELDEAGRRWRQEVSARQRAEARAAAEQAKVDHPSAPVVLRLSQRLLSRVTARLARVLPGTFTMGSPTEEAGRLERALSIGSDKLDPERTSLDFELRHEVTLSRPFLLQATPVTQAQFEAVMGYNPSDFKDPRFPVESVSWFEAVAFCNRLSEQQGLPEPEWAYVLRDVKGEPSQRDFEATVEWRGPERLGFRLPTEAEWEYAVRAGTSTATYNGDLEPGRVKDEQPNPTLDPIAWFGGNSENTTHRVGTKTPNPWGLYDMLGNVWEWVWDWDDMYPSDSVTDPAGPASGKNRVIRGGSWSLYARFCRAAYRGRDWPGHRFNDIGFRPARTLP